MTVELTHTLQVSIQFCSLFFEVERQNVALTLQLIAVKVEVDKLLFRSPVPFGIKNMAMVK